MAQESKETVFETPLVDAQMVVLEKNLAGKQYFLHFPAKRKDKNYSNKDSN